MNEASKIRMYRYIDKKREVKIEFLISELSDDEYESHEYRKAILLGIKENFLIETEGKVKLSSLAKEFLSYTYSLTLNFRRIRDFEYYKILISHFSSDISFLKRVMKYEILHESFEGLEWLISNDFITQALLDEALVHSIEENKGDKSIFLIENGADVNVKILGIPVFYHLLNQNCRDFSIMREVLGVLFSHPKINLGMRLTPEETTDLILASYYFPEKVKVSLLDILHKINFDIENIKENGRICDIVFEPRYLSETSFHLVKQNAISLMKLGGRISSYDIEYACNGVTLGKETRKLYMEWLVFILENGDIKEFQSSEYYSEEYENTNLYLYLDTTNFDFELLDIFLYYEIDPHQIDEYGDTFYDYIEDEELRNKVLERIESYNVDVKPAMREKNY